MATVRKRIRKDGTVAFAVTWREGGKQTSRTFELESDARMLADFLSANNNSFTQAAAAASTVISRYPSVDDTVRRHIESLTSVTAGTREKYSRIHDRHIMPVLGGISIDKLRREDVVRWFNALGLSAKTKKNVHSLLSAALSSAVREGLIESNPAAGIRAERELPKKAPVFLTREQFELIAAAVDFRYSLFVRFLEGTGLRFGEATALTWSDIDLRRENGIIKVTKSIQAGAGGGYKIAPPKTKAGRRTVTMQRALTEAMHGCMVDSAAAAGDLVFQSPFGGILGNGFFHRRVWIPCMDEVESELGVRPRVHDLRHTHASRLIEAGVPLPVIQVRLGHESITTTVGTYGHLAVDADLRAVELLE